ncbi:MAG: hypothetical protein AAB420_01265 [Patescibacteria group bacterium]
MPILSHVSWAKELTEPSIDSGWVHFTDHRVLRTATKRRVFKQNQFDALWGRSYNRDMKKKMTIEDLARMHVLAKKVDRREILELKHKIA